MQHIIIVGCGLAGLTAAIALRRAGHHVEILEAAADIKYIGAGIQVSPNSSRILRRLGVDRFIERYCTEPVDLRMMRWQDGRKLVQCPLRAEAHNRYGAPYWHIHRADFHRGLVECAESLGVKIHLNSRVVKIEPEAPAITTQQGRRHTADLIVASDGIKSPCREAVVGSPSPPVPTGQMVYRVTIPAKALRQYPELDEMITVPRNNHWIGPHGTVLSYLLKGIDETLVNLVMTIDVESDGQKRMPDGVDQRLSSAEAARAAFRGWDARIDLMLRHAERVLEWRLFTHREIASWAHRSKKLIIIGDACHAMTPYLAQGAAMGIEDAAVLGGLLKKYREPSQTARVIRLYEKLRIKRTAAVAAASVDSRYFTQMPDGPEQARRDAWLLDHPGIWKGHINIRSRKEFLDNLFGYDADLELEKELMEQDRLDSGVAGLPLMSEGRKMVVSEA